MAPLNMTHMLTNAIVEKPCDRAPCEPAQLASSTHTVVDSVTPAVRAWKQWKNVADERASLAADERASLKANHRTRNWKWAEPAAAVPTPTHAGELAGAGEHRTWGGWGGQRVWAGPDLLCEPDLWGEPNIQPAELVSEASTGAGAAPTQGSGARLGSASTVPQTSTQQPRRDQQCNHCNLLPVPEAGSALEPGWGLQNLSEKYFPEDVWNKPCKPPYVHVVNTVEGARRAMQLLKKLVEQDMAAAHAHSRVDDLGREFWSRRVFACDTEVSFSSDLPRTARCGRDQH